MQARSYVRLRVGETAMTGMRDTAHAPFALTRQEFLLAAALFTVPFALPIARWLSRRGARVVRR